MLGVLGCFNSFVFERVKVKLDMTDSLASSLILWQGLALRSRDVLHLGLVPSGSRLSPCLLNFQAERTQRRIARNSESMKLTTGLDAWWWDFINDSNRTFSPSIRDQGDAIPALCESSIYERFRSHQEVVPIFRPLRILAFNLHRRSTRPSEEWLKDTTRARNIVQGWLIHHLCNAYWLFSCLDRNLVFVNTWFICMNP